MLLQNLHLYLQNHIDQQDSQKFWTGDLFACAYHGKKEYYVTPSKELDFIITVRNKAVLIGEVKWGKYDGNDIKKFVEKTAFIKAEKVFITKIKNETKIGNVKIMDVDDILAMVK